jgi:formylglycine-generating enzyme required for sulfatase activity
MKKNFIVNGVSFDMIYVEPGMLTVTRNYRPLIAVETLSTNNAITYQTGTKKGFWIGETLVTQELYKAVTGYNPSWYKDRPQNPVERVSWTEANNFAKKLCELGATFRLPEASEWEFAARGGTKSKGYKYAGSDIHNEVAWWNTKMEQNPPLGTYPVKTKKSNELGIYDMSGNVDEWCESKFYQQQFKMICGGSFMQHCKFLVPGEYDTAHERGDRSIGFRLVMDEI